MKTNEPLKEKTFEGTRWLKMMNQQNAAPGEKQRLANSLKQRRREQEGIETSSARLWNKEFVFISIWENGRESESLGVLCSLDSFTEIAERSSQILIRVPSSPFCWRKIPERRHGSKFLAKSPCFFSKKRVARFRPVFNSFGESVATGLSVKLHI